MPVITPRRVRPSDGRVGSKPTDDESTQYVTTPGKVQSGSEAVAAVQRVLPPSCQSRVSWCQTYAMVSLGVVLSVVVATMVRLPRVIVARTLRSGCAVVPA